MTSWAQQVECDRTRESAPVTDRIAHDQDIRLGAAERYSRQIWTTSAAAEATFAAFTPTAPAPGTRIWELEVALHKAALVASWARSLEHALVVWCDVWTLRDALRWRRWRWRW